MKEYKPRLITACLPLRNLVETLAIFPKRFVLSLALNSKSEMITRVTTAAFEAYGVITLLNYRFDHKGSSESPNLLS